MNSEIIKKYIEMLEKYNITDFDSIDVLGKFSKTDGQSTGVYYTGMIENDSIFMSVETETPDFGGKLGVAYDTEYSLVGKNVEGYNFELVVDQKPTLGDMYSYYNAMKKALAAEVDEEIIAQALNVKKIYLSSVEPKKQK